MPLTLRAIGGTGGSKRYTRHRFMRKRTLQGESKCHKTSDMFYAPNFNPFSSSFNPFGDSRWKCRDICIAHFPNCDDPLEHEAQIQCQQIYCALNPVGYEPTEQDIDNSRISAINAQQYDGPCGEGLKSDGPNGTCLCPEGYTNNKRNYNPRTMADCTKIATRGITSEGDSSSIISNPLILVGIGVGAVALIKRSRKKLSA